MPMNSTGVRAQLTRAASKAADSAHLFLHLLGRAHVLQRDPAIEPHAGEGCHEAKSHGKA